MSVSTPAAILLKNYQVPSFFIETVFLEFDIYDQFTNVKSKLVIKRNPQSIDPELPLILNGEDLQLISVIQDEVKLKEDQYKVTATNLTIYNIPSECVLNIHVKIKPQENIQLMGLYKSRSNMCTQCEAEGFRKITYFIDQPDILAYFTTKISADKSQYPYLLSNGNLIESYDLEDNRHTVTWQDPSLKPCYLFALVAGDFDVIEDHFITCSGRTVDIRFYLEKGFKDEAYFAVEALKRAMKWDEEVFGREYDLDIYMVVAVSDFNMGAMENKGLNIFNTRYVLAKDNTATDQDYMAIEGVIAHEYFHNWSGNRVTCRDWFQLTLKEGLTVFRDQCFSRDMTSDSLARIPQINSMRDSQFLEDAGPLAHPIQPQSYMEINNFYTSTVYNKGAEVIRMIQQLVSPTVFRQAMDLYFERHDGQAVTTEDFIQVMEDVSGRDLSQFQRWYHQAGTPELTVDSLYNKDKHTFTLTVRQACPATPGQPLKRPFHIPFAVGLIGPDGKELTLQLEGGDPLATNTCVLEITAEQQSFTFINVTQQPTPSLLRAFSAPIKVHYDYTDQQLAHLLQYDIDSFARWDAGQMLMTRTILALAQEPASERSQQLQQLLLAAIADLLKNPGSDLSLLARLMSLPSNFSLLTYASQVDIKLLLKARHQLTAHLAQHFEKSWLQGYEQYSSNDNYCYSVDAIGQRAMKNLCLSYLTSSHHESYLNKAYQQFKQADNMTETMGALQALNNISCPQRTQALAEFYEQWQHDPLIVNKWLSLQAMSHLDCVVADVKKLMAHSAFNIKNPNNVYALLAVFGVNLQALHAANDDETYRFIADLALKIDTFNPQVAVRIVKPLLGWKQLDHNRALLMRQQLQRIVDAPDLSADLYEIAYKGVQVNM